MKSRKSNGDQAQKAFADIRANFGREAREPCYADRAWRKQKHITSGGTEADYYAQVKRGKAARQQQRDHIPFYD